MSLAETIGELRDEREREREKRERKSSVILIDQTRKKYGELYNNFITIISIRYYLISFHRIVSL